MYHPVSSTSTCHRQAEQQQYLGLIMPSQNDQ
jgi:hypothetical protein